MKNMTEHIVFRFLSRTFDFMILNLLWLLCSLPIITAGASTAALFSVMMKMIQKEDGYILSGFFGAFRKNFLQSTALWLLFLAAQIILGLDFFLIHAMNGMARNFFFFFLFPAEFVLLGIFLYALPIAARYRSPLQITLKNALLLSIAKLPYTLLMLAVLAAAAALTLFNFQTILFGSLIWIFIGGALINWFFSYLLLKTFRVFSDLETR